MSIHHPSPNRWKFQQRKKYQNSKQIYWKDFIKCYLLWCKLSKDDIAWGEKCRLKQGKQASGHYIKEKIVLYTKLNW